MLNISNVSKIVGGEALYNQVSFQIYPGEKVGFVGLNGTGKTTLFRMIIGEDKCDEGQISFPEKLRMAYFSQDAGEMTGKTALDIVLSGDERIDYLKNKIAIFETQLSNSKISTEEMDKILTQMGDIQTEFEKRGGYDLENRAEEILTGLGIQPCNHHKMIDEFSGGQKMRIALAKVLVINPDLIIMDEPTNYLDMETILWLEKWLQTYAGAIFMTTHDRHFMNNVCNKIVEIANKKIVVYSGNYDFYEKDRIVRLKQLQAEFKKQQDNFAKDEEFIARFKARASHASQVQSRIKKLEKIDRIVLPPKDDVIKFEFKTPPRGGDDVVVIKNLKKIWSKKNSPDHLVFDGLNTTIKRLDKLAVVGINGAGKTTLLKSICGQTKPTSGNVIIGPSIKMGYFGQQSFETLKPENSILEEITISIPNASNGFLRNLLAAFLFQGDDVYKKIKYLSGGEKSRLILAILLSQNNNFLVLDEPTNHLDIQSREILLNALKKFIGTILFVSHDRHFLKELAEKVYEVDKHVVNIFHGNYDYYLNKKLN